MKSRATDSEQKQEDKSSDQDRIKELYVWQILEGDASVGMPVGLVQMFEHYMSIKQWTDERKEETLNLINFLRKRASG